jgi:hypothetical protein
MDEEALPILHVKDETGAVRWCDRPGFTKHVKSYVVALLLSPLLLVSGCKGIYAQQYEKGYRFGQGGPAGHLGDPTSFDSTVAARSESPRPALPAPPRRLTGLRLVEHSAVSPPPLPGRGTPGPRFLRVPYPSCTASVSRISATGTGSSGPTCDAPGKSCTRKLLPGVNASASAIILSWSAVAIVRSLPKRR